MVDQARPGLLARMMVLAIDLYRGLVSPWMSRRCRYWPSCSHYVRAAVAQHGAWAGAGLGLARLASCHPFSPGGLDPVPPRSPRHAGGPR